MGKRFYRKMNDKIIGGVCSGLAEYIGMDKSIVRLLALVAIMASGLVPGLLVYFLCCIIVPYDVQAWQDHRHDNYSHDIHEESPYDSEYEGSGEYWHEGNTRKVFGALLIAAGVFLLARLFFDWLNWRYILAGLLIIVGIYILIGSRRN
ncbi:MAG TPA: PspC domain-containing protein [Thermoclostridium sp.]|nr:PspC domain-containing protein [Clostridiaceae bacterium]HOQ76153.1 PspC domain-containing protein [Thermoclostridium sp.]HPU44872.1 PspC domain-containing protein [Thermoclostridium sp.]